LDYGLKPLQYFVEKCLGNAGFSFAEFERAMLRERTRTGLESARREGRVGGRRPKLTTQQQKEIVGLVSSGQKMQQGYLECIPQQLSG